MILLDTNVVSEFMTSQPADAVLHWLNEQDVDGLYFSSVSIAEIEFGLRAMPDGRRRDLLQERFERFIQMAFESRVLVFDQAAARLYGKLRARRRAMGRPMSGFDAQIAAIAVANGLALATRNTRDFQECGLALENPFER